MPPGRTASGPGLQRTCSAPALLQHTDCPPVFAILLTQEHREADATEQLARGKRKSFPMLLPTPICCHLIPYFRDVLHSLERQMLENQKEQQGKPMGCEQPWDRHSHDCGSHRHTAMPPLLGESLGWPGSSGHVGLQHRKGHPIALWRDRREGKRKKNQSPKDRGKAEL